ncbi:NAD-dependent malic enzyme [Pantoea stewartii]|uniref:NAD-dependent malic enzyme n=1 Tax=Pantoea stewartii TaxID=66269 RepID=UPI002DB8493C|nr:NAD-dependent malic enzyme [Pantoea stewartii]MEB6537096.1 NAD-dependent malic enzyme [Pantoea stewartii]
MTVFQDPILPSPKGVALLKNPGLNKGTAFTQEERLSAGLEGLLPSNIETLDLQVTRALLNVEKKADDLERYTYLQDLEERNEVVFYKTVMSDPKRFIPILYDPVVADACLEFGHIYRRPRGMYITHHMRGRIAEVLRNWPVKDVRFICVTTGGRILGLGDIGANGMGIPIGKLQLYTACAGVPPECLLPVLLDIGTTNQALLDDPMYLGLHEPPINSKELDALTEEFVNAVQTVFPGCCIHFEDWKGTDALRYLERYKDRVLCYNDDIQGTASIALAGVSAALNITGGKLTEQRVLFLGAGSAGLGIAKLIVKEMTDDGLTEHEAVGNVRFMDINGLINQARHDLTPEQARYAQDEPSEADLVELIQRFKPTILFGVSTKAGAFTQQVVETMSRLNERPIIFALSNPTSKVECTAEQAYRWSNGKALFAAGVQFPEFSLNGRTFHPGQANNFYIYPAIGLATYATQPSRLNDECFIVAAHATADQITPEMREKGMLYPGQDDILSTEVTTAVRVAEYLFDVGLATVERPENIRQWIESLLYKPEY